VTDPLARREAVTTFARPNQPQQPVTVRGRALHAIRSKLFRDTGWTMVAEIAGMASQFVTLVLIGRAFDKAVFGQFAGAVAFMNVIAPFTTVGMGYILLQRIAGEDADPDLQAGRAWVTITIGGLVGLVFVLATSWIFLPNLSVHVLVALGLGELVFSQITYAGRYCAQAFDRPAIGARIVAFVWAVRLLAAILFLIVVPHPTLGGWAVFHMSASLIGAIIMIVSLRRIFSLRPRISVARRNDIRQGLAYSLTIGAAYLKNDADKTLLVTFNKDEAAGLYSLAYRVITPLYVPVRALADSTFARFFREANHAPHETYALARRTTAIGAGLTVLGGLAVVAAAPLLPFILSDKWRPVVVVTQWLAFVPCLVAMQMYAFNALMSLGRRTACLVINASATVLNIVLNLVLIPVHSWKGATAATISAEAMSVVALWWLLRREVTRNAPTREHLRSLAETRV
jgi:O-antigen/teichoic acid export membrane protein